MIKINFRDQAVLDLSSIKNYFQQFSQATVDAVADDIDEALQVLRTFPESGAPKSYNRRIIISTKYKFKISYLVKNEQIDILGIYRFQNR